MQLPIVAFNVARISSQEIAMILDSHYDIAVRAGLHCSPLAHQTLATTEQGIVRASLGPFNTEQEVDRFLQAIEEIADRKSTRLNSSHVSISYAVFCLKKKNPNN